MGISTIELITQKNLKEVQKLDLKEAIDISHKQKQRSPFANTKVDTKKLEVQSMKNNQYPDVKVSGQYMRLTNASVDLKTNLILAAIRVQDQK
jgi:hypothetical protein